MIWSLLCSTRRSLHHSDDIRAGPNFTYLYLGMFQNLLSFFRALPKLTYLYLGMFQNLPSFLRAIPKLTYLYLGMFQNLPSFLRAIPFDLPFEWNGPPSNNDLESPMLHP